MDLLDVNVLVNAYRRDAPDHPAFCSYVQAFAETPNRSRSQVWSSAAFFASSPIRGFSPLLAPNWFSGRS